MYSFRHVPVRDKSYFLHYKLRELQNLYYERFFYKSINRAILTYIGFEDDIYNNRD